MTKLTKTVVERTPLPTTPGGQTFVWCSETRGFGCRINEGGSRTYIAQGRVNGRERRVSIGRHGVFTVDQARDQAQEILRSMRLGVDPVEAKAKEQAQGVTLRETIADYVTHKRTKNGPLRPRTKADIQYHADRHFADWMDKPVRTITRKACAARFADISKTAPATANQAFVILRGLLNFARDRYRTDDEPLLPENPVDVLKRTWHPTKARTERVPNDKMGAVWAALDRQRTEGSVARGLSTAAAFVQFQLLTGARWGEAAMLTWDRVDLDGRVPSWRLEDDQAKNGIGRTLPLSSQAVVILKALPRKRGNNYVFVKRGDKGHIGDPRATYELVSKIAGLHVSSHSMRRTFTNVALKLGIEMWKTELLTNHIPQSVTLMHYTETEDLRESCAAEVQRIGDWIEQQAIRQVLEQRYFFRALSPGTMRDALLLEAFDFNELVEEDANPQHGHSNFHLGHQDPTVQPKHKPDNITWRSHRSNLIQGNMTLRQSRIYFVKLIARYFELGELTIT